MKSLFRLTTLLCFLAFSGAAVPAFAELSEKEVQQLLEDLDQRQRALGDYKAILYMEQKTKGKADMVFQAVTYRRETEEKFVFVFMKPKSETGKGYLVLGGNLFWYDPSVGRWERRTERERFGGTDSRRQDFDVKNLTKNYNAEYAGDDKLGNFEVHHIKLTAKKDTAVPFPIMHLWLDKKTNNMLKQQDFSLSGKLLRTLYFPKWKTEKAPDSEHEIHYPREIRIFDELQKGNQTVIVLQKVVLGDLPENLFTKAWLERKSR